MDDLLCSEDKTDFAGMSFEKLLGFYYLRMFYLGYEFFFSFWILKIMFYVMGSQVFNTLLCASSLLSACF